MKMNILEKFGGLFISSPKDGLTLCFLISFLRMSIDDWLCKKSRR